MKQTIGMIMSALIPDQYEVCRKVVSNWSDTTAFRALVHTERETSTLTVINNNVAATPHWDPEDSADTLTALNGWGNYDREKGGQLCVPLLGRSYTMFTDSILLMALRRYLHFVLRPVNGPRYSMVHTTQANLQNFNATRPNTAVAQRKAFAKEARENDQIDSCPFCGKRFEAGTPSVNKHLNWVIKKGTRDKNHDVKRCEAMVKELSDSIAKSGRLRRETRRITKLETIQASTSDVSSTQNTN